MNLTLASQVLHVMSKSVDWFPYDNGLRHEIVNSRHNVYFSNWLGNIPSVKVLLNKTSKKISITFGHSGANPLTVLTSKYPKHFISLHVTFSDKSEHVVIHVLFGINSPRMNVFFQIVFKTGSFALFVSIFEVIFHHLLIPLS